MEILFISNKISNLILCKTKFQIMKTTCSYILMLYAHSLSEILLLKTNYMEK